MLKKISTESAAGYFLFAFIAMAGLAYINFLPGVVSALAGGIGFDQTEAGQIVAVNLFGGLLGCTCAVFLVRRIKWKPAIFIPFATLALIDLSSVWVDDYSLMLGMRLLAGVLGGLGMGVAFSVLARLNNPDRAFGALLFVQFVIGALVIYLLPLLENMLSTFAVFYVMAGIVLLSLIFLMLLSDLPQRNTSAIQAMALSVGWGNALLLMLAIIFYLCAANAIWAYVELMGLGAGMDDESVSSYIAMTGLLGLAGAMLPILSGNKFGRFYWIAAGVVLSIVAAVMLSASELTPLIYISAMALLFFCWPAVNSYLLAIAADFDSSGRLSSVAAVVSLVGLAAGPLMASGLLDDGSFTTMLHAAAGIFLVSFLMLFRPVKALEKQQS
ncbi:MFS transporter [Bowmanella denitrificans]|uniref:MFS transporter n=1 Tax=Bowmanella denitrificans TaxID=366582 RepID=A0ABN0WLX0_9ALTE